MRKFLWPALIAALLLPAIPASAGNAERSAQARERGGDKHDGRHGPREHRDNRAEKRADNRAYQRQIERRNDRRTDRQRRNRQQARIVWQNYNRYDYNRPDPRYGTYYAERYYRDSSYYQPYTLSRGDRIYRGSNGRYYCRRNDGTTGLIIGALGGGLLGDAIAPRGSKTLGAILGGTSGALLGRSIDRDGVRCQ